MLTQTHINEKKNDSIDKRLNELQYKIIVLDDDPTGTQTVKDLPVYTEWTEEWIEDGFLQSNNMFYILTNSRALNEEETKILHHEVSANIQSVSKKLNHPYLIISRGDSTLRGHFYLEPKVLSESADQVFDAVFYIPAFFEGHRYTFNGVHYLKENEAYIPVSESEFANDTTFGFNSKSMKAFINEKSKNTINIEDIYHISLDLLRKRDKTAIHALFNELSHFDQVVVDAVNDEDMDFFVSCLTSYLLEHDKRFIFRTAASFVKAICETPGEMINLRSYEENQHGGMIVVGSHVKKSSEQLEYLLNHTQIKGIEFDVKEVIKPSLPLYIIEMTEKVESYIENGQDVVIYTSRDVIRTEDLQNNLSISTTISNSLVTIVSHLKIQPKFIIAKGGITSSDVATKGLQIKKATVVGQITQGVPVWLTGKEAKYHHMPYVIFPGNVGEASTLSEVYELNK
ncbi:four-carbon acid sugar kinase family protein [Mammaliicoccus sp. Dog046]|uniref:four-carbon acid sugar kinase family protein n=1 Tax=Mammaliicoccus sp. Dog046 TaxID=3034233 RepID=UPI002B2617CC|nr:four-carbon acid sugar kinase family protein [Mammaliicoccus sp. Dog046]WQK85749.1 four-carbon acid sugar kinase family protein [Mammaliicoccus sp. Dog046]